jgi:hypothetical protein
LSGRKCSVIMKAAYQGSNHFLGPICSCPVGQPAFLIFRHRVLCCPLHFSGCLGFKLPLSIYVAHLSKFHILVALGVQPRAWEHVTNILGFYLLGVPLASSTQHTHAGGILDA